MAENYDFIIVGSGPNGLFSGCYLAKAGQKVLVLERMEEIGGGCPPVQELTGVPGFKHNRHSIWHVWMPYTPPYTDLEMEKYGCKYYLTKLDEPINCQVYRDGRALMFWRDLDRMCKGLEKFSKRDAETWRELGERLRPFKETLLSMFFTPPPQLSQVFAPLEESVEGQRLMVDILSTAEDFCDTYFESPQIKAWLQAQAVNMGMPPDASLSGTMIVATGFSQQDTPAGLCIGGSGAVTQALVNCLKDNGGEIRNKTHVDKVLIENGEAKGVILSDGTEIRCNKAVISDTAANRTMLDLVGEEHLDEHTLFKAKNFKWCKTALNVVHLALNERPHWKAEENEPDVSKCWVVIQGCDTPEEIMSVYNDAKEKKIPRCMGNLSFIPTIPDPSQAPPGKHTFAIWFFGNHSLEGDPENWHKKSDEIIDLCLDKLQAYTTNINKDNILGRKLYSCYDIGLDIINMEYGDQVGGETSLTQMFGNRPWPGMSDYRTPIENLYVTGMTCHPAGGIHGAPGYNTVGAVCDDLDIEKWWEEED